MHKDCWGPANLSSWREYSKLNIAAEGGVSFLSDVATGKSVLAPVNDFSTHTSASTTNDAQWIPHQKDTQK